MYLVFKLAISNSKCTSTEKIISFRKITIALLLKPKHSLATMRNKYYIYHRSYELIYLSQQIRRMSWFK